MVDVLVDVKISLTFLNESTLRCTTGSWSIPVTLVIGPRQGISYTTDSTATATHMTEFSHIQSIQTLESGSGSSKGLCQLRVAGSAELLTVTCPSLREAENIADLVDGYCRQVNNSPTSIWIRKGKNSLKRFFFCMYSKIVTFNHAAVGNQGLIFSFKIQQKMFYVL